jgi:hypothetical protein
LTTSLIVVAIVLALALIAPRLLSRGRRHDAAHPSDNLDTLAAWPPRATRVLNTAERQAYDLLCNALPGHMILAQVPLQRFIKVPTRNSYAEWLRRVGQLNADFVVCDAHSQVIAVVEIESEDDQPRSRAQRRRERMLRTLKSAQVPVHVWRAGALPPIGAAREAILPAALATELAEAAAAGAALRSMPGRIPTASDVVDGPDAPMREPPPSTWFDDFDSAPAPLASEPPKSRNDNKSRPGR